MRYYLKLIHYYLRVLKIYEEAYSLERVMMVINIIASEYNNMGKYYLALEECNKILNYSFTLANHKYARSLSLHYIFPNYMLDKNEEV